MKLWRFGPLALAMSFVLVGCHLDMWVQPRVNAQSENEFYSGGQGTRPPVKDTVEFGKPLADDAFYTGFEDGKLVAEFPVEVDKEFIVKGKEQYEIFCTHCHGAIGDGKGMIAQRGFELRRPVGNYHTDRLRDMPVGHFYDVITNGYGTMYPQGGRIRPLDRWAIVAYIRALQLSQFVSREDLDAETAEMLETSAGMGFGELFVTPRDFGPPVDPVPTEEPTGMGSNEDSGEGETGVVVPPPLDEPSTADSEGDEF